MVVPPTIPALHRTRVKICGVCRGEDALIAARAGADAIGLVCYPPAGRFVRPEAAREIVQSLPAFVASVALFVDPSAAELAETMRTVGASCVQLHGDETPAFLAAVALPVIKAIRVDRASFERELQTWRTAIAQAQGKLNHLKGLVLETAGPGVGGTGRANDWAFVADVASRGGFAGLPPVIAAGGLSPETVGDVIRAIRPWAVDVSSGVERIKREKAPDLIERFIAAVREADAAKNR